MCSVRFYLQLFVGGLISYLRYLCLFAYSDVQHILCYVFSFSFVFVCLRLVSCVPNVLSFSGVSVLDCPCGFLIGLFNHDSLINDNFISSPEYKNMLNNDDKNIILPTSATTLFSKENIF